MKLLIFYCICTTIVKFTIANQCSKTLYFGTQKFEKTQNKWVSVETVEEESKRSFSEIRETQLLPKNQSRWEYFENSNSEAEI